MHCSYPGIAARTLAVYFWTVVFAVTDWSDERRTFKPFADALALPG